MFQSPGCQRKVGTLESNCTMRTAQEKAISTTIANSVLQAYGMQSKSATGQEGQKHTSRLGLLLAITLVIVWMPESRSRLACQLIDDGRTAISDRTAGQMLIYDYTACLSPLVVGLGTPIAALTRVLIRRPYRRSVVWILVVMTWVVLILSPHYPPVSGVLICMLAQVLWWSSSCNLTRLPHVFRCPQQQCLQLSFKMILSWSDF